jgi:hypothetical protein
MANSGLIIQQSNEEVLLTCESDGMVVTVDSNEIIIMSTEGQPGRDGQVVSVTGLNTDNTDPANPIIRLSVDGVTITGLGTPGSPLIATATSAVWGQITGTLSNQTDLQNALNGKQNLNSNLTSLAGLSTTNTIYYLSAVGTFSPVTIGANLSFSGGILSAAGSSSVEWGQITGTLSDQTDLQSALNAKVTANSAITGATKTKITYDAKGLVTAGADATTSDIAEGSNLYFTTARARQSLSGGTGINYNSITGVITNTAPFTGVTTDGVTLNGDGTGGNPLAVNYSGISEYNFVYLQSGNLVSTSVVFYDPGTGAIYADDAQFRISWKASLDKYANWDASNLSRDRTIIFQDRSGTMSLWGDDLSSFVNDAGFITGVSWGSIGGTLSSQTDLQSALNAKQNTITGGATTITSSNLSASRALVSDGSGKVAVATTTSTEIGYVNGVTSAIQTQLNDKLGTTLTSAQIFVGNVSNVATGVVVSGDVSMANTGAATVISASDTQAGKVELATIAETNTGTDAARAVTPDGLSQSYAGTKSVSISVTAPTENTATGDGKAYITIPEALNGMNLVRATATVVTAGTTNATTIQIYNVTQAADMLSGLISIASGGTVATAGTIDTANDDVATNDVLRVDVDTISTTPAKGLMVILEFRLP